MGFLGFGLDASPRGRPILWKEAAPSKKWPNFSFLKGNWSEKYIPFETTLLVTEIGFFKTLPKRIKILENRSGFGGGVYCRDLKYLGVETRWIVG